MKQYHIFYTSLGREFTRIEFATNDLKAIEQAKEHFRMFGNGDESNFESFAI